MSKIVYLFNRYWNPNEQDVNAYLIAVKNLSMRSVFEYSLEEIKKIKSTIKKPIYLLCDALIGQKEIQYLKDTIVDIFDIAEKVFFQDFSIFQLALKHGCVDKLVYYSPTLAVSYFDINALKELGINDIIISKEATIFDYKTILNECSNVNLGMLAFGYPQIYFSKRSMISSYSKQYSLNIDNKKSYYIKEKSRDFYQPIIEDSRGTYIFAGEVYFPFKYYKDFINNGMEYLLFDPIFIENIEKCYKLFVKSIASEKIIADEIDFKTSDFMIDRIMINDYEKKN